MYRAGVIGASGYVGGEVVRILVGHRNNIVRACIKNLLVILPSWSWPSLYQGDRDISGVLLALERPSPAGHASSGSLRRGFMVYGQRLTS